jgi:hypothetical protein
MSLQSTQRRFLVDTGAPYSIFPFSSPGKLSSPHLTGADGLHIPGWGERQLFLVFHGRRFEWPFLLARVQFPIIGVDFLRHFKLLVDPAASRLDSATAYSFQRAQPARTSRDLGEPPRHRCTLRQHTAAVKPIAIPARRFTHIQVDIVGPMPAATCGSRYLLERSSRWLEALPMRDIVAATCADTLIAGWISRYEVPAQLTSDRGTQFTSAIWASLCKQLGIQHQPTTAFHLQASGMVERCHRRLMDALRARLAGPDWPLHLPWVLMELRAAPTENTGVSAAKIVFGAPLVLPGQILDADEPPPADFIAKLRQSGPPPPSRPLSYAQMAAKPPAALLSAAFVYVCKGDTFSPLSPLYSGP